MTNKTYLYEEQNSQPFLINSFKVKGRNEHKYNILLICKSCCSVWLIHLKDDITHVQESYSLPGPKIPGTLYYLTMLIFESNKIFGTSSKKVIQKSFCELISSSQDKLIEHVQCYLNSWALLMIHDSKMYNLLYTNELSKVVGKGKRLFYTLYFLAPRYFYIIPPPYCLTFSEVTSLNYLPLPLPQRF